MVEAQGQNRVPIISVVGSLNADIFIQVKRCPMIGETLDATGVKRAFGGKVRHRIQPKFVLSF